MSTKEWFKPTNNDISPFDGSYIEEFELPPERTEQELRSLEFIIAAMNKKPRTLDIAGGFGRIGSELVKKNLVDSLVNLDLNRQFLKKAASNQVMSAVEGDMRHLSFRNGSFDLALIMFTSFGYFEDKSDDLIVLREAYRVLNPGGKLILDLPNYARISDNFSANREMSLKNGDTIRYRKRIEGGYLIEERSRIKRNGGEEKLSPIKLRLYFPEDITKLCQEAGFNEVRISDQELRDFSPHISRRLWVISTK
jgi:SAM-dependent methyltransferase